MDRYKEKYEQALAKASKLRVQNPFDTVGRMVEHIFPELAESEDEKIKKEIIAIFKGEIPYTSGEDAKRYIDWIEKQKEFVSADFDDVWETADCDELTAPLEKYSKDAIKKMCHAWYDKGIELERRNWLNQTKQEWEQEKSEDERIRKGLINGFKECLKDCPYPKNAVKYWHDVEVDSILAWLEKQSGKKSADEVLKIRQELYQSGYNDGYKHGQEDMVNKESDNELTRKSLINFLKSPFVNENITDEKVAPWIAWLEKQDTKEVDPRYKYLENLLTADDIHQMSMNEAMIEEAKTKAINALSKIGISELLGLEEQSEQNPVDKAKPKFHPGDWITDGQLTCKVLGVINKSYELHLYNDDYCHFETDVQSVDKYYRLWTIVNAKDGDVLQLGKVTAIFKSYIGSGRCACYCSVYDGKFEIPGQDDAVDSYDSYGCHNAKPATKEQRDLLSRKMKEADYKWDSEKKELKTIGQKPSDKAEPKFKVGDWCIDNEDDTIFQIVKVLDHTYTYRTNEGKEYSCTHYSLENDARLWTIEDAKDGDVLAFKNNISGIIICKSPTNYDTRSYCRFISNDFIDKEESGWDSILLIPATKEQRDLLFQKMEEEGYKWDSEKKELWHKYL